MHPPVFMFRISRTWKQPKCPLAEEQIEKTWYVYTMEYYLAISRNEIICRDVNGATEYHTE